MSATVNERIAEELEALEAILMGDVRITKEAGLPTSVETVVHPSTGNDIDKQFVCLTLDVTLIPTYPEDSPEVTLRNPRGLDDQVVNSIESEIMEKLKKCVGQPVVFELIEIVRDNLTRRNLPSGQCVICLYSFKSGDVFVKTPCYHHFHNFCLGGHLLSDRNNYEKEYNKLPNWQQMQAAPYHQTCPICRSQISFNVENLKSAPVPVESLTEPPFRLTSEMRALQSQMAAVLARQVAKGGVVGMGDDGPPPLTITSPSDNDEASNPTPGCSHHGVKAAGGASARPGGSSSNAPASPPPRQPYRGPYRGFNRRGKPGRRGRGGR